MRVERGPVKAMVSVRGVREMVRRVQVKVRVDRTVRK